ncbi:MAG: hypothetical protein ACRD9W_09555, partial [Terriglobia bacterium]
MARKSLTFITALAVSITLSLIPTTAQQNGAPLRGEKQQPIAKQHQHSDDRQTNSPSTATSVQPPANSDRSNTEQFEKNLAVQRDIANAGREAAKYTKYVAIIAAALGIIQ